MGCNPCPTALYTSKAKSDSFQQIKVVVSRRVSQGYRQSQDFGDRRDAYHENVDKDYRLRRPYSMRDFIDRLQNFRYFFLLISLIALMIVSPVFEATKHDQSVVAALFTLVLLSAVNAASDKRWQRIFAVSLAVPWLVLRWGGEPLGFGEGDIERDILLVAMTGFAIAVVLGHVLNEKEVSFDILCGAVAIYLLLGVSWAIAFGVLESLAPGTIFHTNTNAELTSTDLLYFSFTTLTTLGYGDVTPISPVARIWANLEAVMGTLYIAVLVARLVSLYRR